MVATLEKILAGRWWRELYEGPNIRGSVWDSSVPWGHPLNLMGAAKKALTTKGTIMRGLEFWDLSNNADIDFDPPALTGFTAFWRFKRSAVTTGANQRLIARLDGNSDGFELFIDGADDLLFFSTYQGGAHQDTKSLTALDSVDTVYTVILTYTKENVGGDGLALLYLLGVADTDTGAEEYGAHTDPADVAAGTVTYSWSLDNLGTLAFLGTAMQHAIFDGVATAAEVLLMHKGIIPDTLDDGGSRLRHYLADEGRGSALDDRGATGADATYGTNGGVLEWDTDVDLCCLGLDGHGDYAVSAANVVDIMGGVSFVWAGQLMATYDGMVDSAHWPYEYRIDASNRIYLSYHPGDNTFKVNFRAEGISFVVEITYTPSIGDHGIIILTLGGGTGTVYGDGVYNNSGPVTRDIGGGLATVYIGSEFTPQYYDVSRPVLHGIVDGCLSATESILLSAYLNVMNKTGIPIL